MTATTRRCALFAAHAGGCAVWPNLRDDVEPRNGRRCTERVERPPQQWTRPILRRQLVDEWKRRAIVASARLAAAQAGYRGRVRFVADPAPGREDMFAVVVEVAR